MPPLAVVLLWCSILATWGALTAAGVAAALWIAERLAPRRRVVARGRWRRGVCVERTSLPVRAGGR